MKKLLSLLLVATIVTSTLCVSYFAFDNVDNLSNITTSEPTDKEIETSTISTSDEATPDEITTEPSSSTTESSTIESSTEPTTTEPTEVKVSSIKLNATSKTLYNGKSTTLKATVFPINATNKSLTWKSSNTKVATIDKNGKVKALKVGNATITATSTDGSNVSAQCKIKVVQRVTKIKLNKSIINLSKKGKTAKLKATVLPNNAYNKSVTWKSNNTKVVTVDKNGKIKATTNKGTTYVNAIAKDGRKIRTRILVVVGKKVKKITLNKTSVTLNRGAKNRTFQLKKAIKNKNATYKGVSWYSSNKNVATVNSNGKVTIKHRGKVVITVKAKDGSNKSAKCKFTVKQLVTKLSYNNKKQVKEVYKNKTIKFAVTVVPSNANNKGLTYSSSNKKVATVNSKGVIKGIKAGTVTITAKAKDGSRKAVKLTVKVKNPPISDNTKLTIKQLKSKLIVKRHCDMLNNYFKSCGATIEPRLKGQHQWYVEDTSNYCVDNFTSLNDWYIETLSYWIQEMSTDTLKNDGEWNGYTDMNKWEKEVLDSFIYWDKNGYPQYRKNLILDSKYNGFDWLINTYTKKTNKFLVYVDFEKFKIKGKDYKDNKGNQEYVIKFYYNWQSIEDYNNHKDPRD
ncbi:ig domain protein group 2 domain protein [Eubacterium sp. CAG:581]|nr:ig domain protein group 2 domain protein [Eubacterium sp. CAG:581]